MSKNISNIIYINLSNIFTISLESNSGLIRIASGQFHDGVILNEINPNSRTRGSHVFINTSLLSAPCFLLSWSNRNASRRKERMMSMNVWTAGEGHWGKIYEFVVLFRSRFIDFLFQKRTRETQCKTMAKYNVL